MPVSRADTVDAIGLDPATDTVALSMFEEREWESIPSRLKDLEGKLNCYLDFVHGGQINDTPEYRGKRVTFEIYCQFSPPFEVRRVMSAMKSHLENQQIQLRVFVGLGRSIELNVDE